MKLFILLFCAFSAFNLLNVVLGDECSEEYQEKKYVDPNSLYYSRQKKKVVIPEYDGSGNSDDHAIVIKYEKSEYQSYCSYGSIDRSYEVFARRLINILLKNSRLKIKNENVTGNVNIEASLNQLEILRGFGKGKISIRELDGIIGEVIKQPDIDLFEEIFSYTDMILFYIYERRRIFLSILFSLVVIPIIIKGTRTKLRVVTMLFSIMTIISFIMTWQQLLQDAEIKLLAQRSMYYKTPDECKTMDLGLVRSFMLFWGVGQGDCLKYYEAMMKDPMLEVTPTQAFMHMCSKSIAYPMMIFSKEFANFIDIISDALPWWLRPIAKPLIFFLTLLIVYATVFIIAGGKFGIRIGPLFHFYIHGRESWQPSIGVRRGDRQPLQIISSSEIQEVENFSQNDIYTEITEEMNKRQAETPSVSVVQVKKKSPVTVEKSMQSKEVERTSVEAEGSSDSYSDDFSEDNDYEKISKEGVESEMSRTKIEVIEGENVSREKKKGKIEATIEKSLEIGGGDS